MTHLQKKIIKTIPEVAQVSHLLEKDQVNCLKHAQRAEGNQEKCLNKHRILTDTNDKKKPSFRTKKYSN